MLGKIEGSRRGKRMSWLDSITDLMDMSLSKLQKTVRHREAWHAAVHGVPKSRKQMSVWTTNKTRPLLCAKSIQPYPTLYDPVQLCTTLFGTVARQAPLPMGFSRQEYWSGLPCPPPGDPPDPGIKPESLRSPALAGSSPLGTLGKPDYL